jgi:hypothetical protein
MKCLAVKMLKWLIEDMTTLRNDKLMKWQLMKWLVEKMTG